MAERCLEFVQSLSSESCRCGGRSCLGYHSDDIRNEGMMVYFRWLGSLTVPGLLGLLAVVVLVASVCDRLLGSRV